MAIPLNIAESIAEKLYDFNPNLTIDIDKESGENEVLASIDMLKLSGDEFQVLAGITVGWSVTFLTKEDSETTEPKITMMIY